MNDRLRQFANNVLAIAYKELAALRQNPAVLSTVMIQPVIMLALFGFGLSNRPQRTPWVVLDRSATAASRSLIADIRHTGYFAAPSPVTSYGAARSALQRQEALLALIIPSDFRRDVERRRPTVQVLLDGSEPLTAARLGAYVNQVAAGFRLHRARPEPVRPPVDLRQRFWFNPTLLDRQFFLAGLAGTLLTNLCLSVTSGGIVAERESGTYEQMLALPTSPLEIVLGKVLPFVGLSYFVLALAIVLPGLVFGQWPQGSILALLVVTLPFVLASLAIGVFVSTLAHTSAQAVFITIFFILPSFVLSGSMMPYALMPHGIREAGAILPLRWYQIAMRRVVERGAGLAEIAGPILVLMGIFVGLLLLIRWRMRPRLG
jgi:ABC-2 type transport system permease protein